MVMDPEDYEENQQIEHGDLQSRRPLLAKKDDDDAGEDLPDNHEAAVVAFVTSEREDSEGDNTATGEQTET